MNENYCNIVGPYPACGLPEIYKKKSSTGKYCSYFLSSNVDSDGNGNGCDWEHCGFCINMNAIRDAVLSEERGL